MMSTESLNTDVNVSELVLYTNCPRRVYFTSRGFELFPEVNASRVERMLLKELSLNYSEVIKNCSLKPIPCVKNLKLPL